MTPQEISVLVCSYGAQEWMHVAARAVRSASEQGAKEVLSIHSVQSTLAEVRNLAAGAAVGEWLCFLDADDELEPGYLSAMSAAANMSSDLYVPAVRYCSEVHRNCGEPAILDQGRPLFELNWAPIGTLLRRELFFEVGGFRELLSLEDWELWLRCASGGAKLVPVPGAVYRVWQRHGSRNVDQSIYWQIRREHEKSWELQR